MTLSLVAADGDPLVSVGPWKLTEDRLDGLLAAGGKVLLIILISALVIRIANRLMARAVASVRDQDGPVDRLRDRAWASEGGDARSKRIDHTRRVRRAEAMSSVGSSIVTVVVWTLATLTALSTVGVPIGTYIAGVGIVGVALGFGAQDLVKDFISGVFMLLEDQYGIGDIVDSGQATGVVEGISLRTTRIRGLDGTLWYVPNGEIRRLGNMSQEWARALLDVSVAYGTDIDHAIAVIDDVATGMAEEDGFADTFLAEPEVWGVEDLGSSGIAIRLVIQTTPGDQWSVSRELRRRLKHAFDDEGIEIPFPQTTVWVRDPARQEVLSAVDDDDRGRVRADDRAPTSSEELKGNPAEVAEGDAAEDVGIDEGEAGEDR